MTIEITTPTELTQDIPIVTPESNGEANADVDASPADQVKQRRKSRMDGIRVRQQRREDDAVPVETSPSGDTPATTGMAKAPSKLSKPLQELQFTQDKTLAEYCKDLGIENGMVRIDIFRHEPERALDQKSGKFVKVSGFLESVKNLIDESYLQEKHGGGKYKLRINTPQGPNGKFHYFKMVELEVGGEPRLDFLPKTSVMPDPAPAAAGSAESPSIVRDVLNVMKDQIDKANDRSKETGVDPSMSALLSMMKEQNQTMAQEAREMRAQIIALQNRPVEKVPDDGYKDKLLTSLIDGDSARIQAVRAQYDSELRIARDNMDKLETRLRDSFDRERQRIEDTHRREIDMLKSSHEMTIQLLRQSHEQAIASTKISLDTSKEVLNAQVAQLKREVDTLREDNKELREKKEKSPLELAKDFKTYKEVFGEGDGNEATTVDKIVEALPQVVDGVGTIINQRFPSQAQKQAAAQQAAPQRPQIMRAPDGTMYAQRGNQLVPVRKKGQVVQVPPTAEGQPPREVEIPAIDPEKVTMAISYLERACTGNQDPSVVAQSAKPFVPEEILRAISELGIDVFLSKVAKLPSASPLMNQAGKNWVRKVAKALVGE